MVAKQPKTTFPMIKETVDEYKLMEYFLEMKEK